MTNKDRITAAILLFVLSYSVVITAGYIREKGTAPAEQEKQEVIAVISETAHSPLWEEEMTADTSAPLTETDTEPASAPSETVTENPSILPGEVTETSADTSVPMMININTAAEEELETLPGVGEKTARAIIEYRSRTPFTAVEDIMNVDGIGEKKFENIKSMICV